MFSNVSSTNSWRGTNEAPQTEIRLEIVIIIVGPGQGAQKPGFLEPWLDSAGAEALFATYSDVVGLDLAAAGTKWDAERITDTSIAQPLIVAASLLSLSLLRDAIGQGGLPPSVGVAGHSVGEFTALAAAGVVSDVDALRLVAVRGRAMAEAAATVPTGMSAVLGGDESDVVSRLTELGLTPANRNGGGQIVAAGAKDALATLAAEPAPKTKVIPLAVAGAFHTAYMAPAAQMLRQATEGIAVTDPKHPLWTNRDGSRVTTGADAIAAVIGQVASPVRWDLCMESFLATGITGLVELCPAGTLTGLAKRAMPGVPAIAVRTPADLDAAVELIAKEESA